MGQEREEEGCFEPNGEEFDIRERASLKPLRGDMKDDLGVPCQGPLPCL